MEEVRIALLGFGYWGPKIGASLSKVSNCKLVAVVDPSQTAIEKSRQPALQSEILFFSSIDQLLNSEVRVDAVIIATPPVTHEILTKTCLTAGKHVLVEKPIFFSESSGRELMQLANQGHLVLMPGHTFLYNDAVLWAKNFIKEGGIGEVLCAYSSRLNLGQLRNDTNVVWSLAPHDVSIFNLIFESEPEFVSATGAAVVQPEILDFAHMSLFYPGNRIGHAHVSWLDPGKERKVTVLGTLGMMTIDDTAKMKIRVHEKHPSSMNNELGANKRFLLRDSGKIFEPLIDFREPLVMELQNFVDSILGTDSPRATSLDGLSVARTLSAVEDSIRENGKSVEIGGSNIGQSH